LFNFRSIFTENVRYNTISSNWLSMPDDLSEEHKQRILQEERQRLAEEQYRAQVRRDLQAQNAGAAPVLAPIRSSAGANNIRNVSLVVGVLVVVGVIAFFALRSKNALTPQSSTGTSAPERIARASAKPSPAGPPPPEKLTTAQIAEKATASVVVVENLNEDGEKAGQGSGYAFSADGIIITNYHVIRGAKSLNVRVQGKEPYTVESVLGYEIDHDLAALQVTGASIPALTTETVDEPKVGDRVVAIGAPLGLESTVSEGIVSALRTVGTINIIQTTASISPGSSGGPLLNEYGKVVGLTTATMVNGQSINFVVSAKHISELLSRKESTSLEDMLNRTRVSDSIASTTIMVPARNAMQVSFNVSGQQGAMLEGTYTVSGGTGKDVAVMVLGPAGNVVLNSGRVTGYGQFKQRLPRGKYTILFDNRFSTFSSKSVSPDLKLTYYR
jgi:S1-C subfamily serine protease